MWWGAALGVVATPLVLLLARTVTHRPARPGVGTLVATLAACAAAGLAVTDLRPAVVAVAYAAASAAMIAAALVDVTEHRLPNVFTYPLAVGGLVVLTAVTLTADVGSPARALAGMGIYGGWLFLAALTGLGAGDVKLAAATGVWLAWQSWTTLLLGIAAGQIAITALHLIGRRQSPRKREASGTPLGPGIVLGYLVALVTVS